MKRKFIKIITISICFFGLAACQNVPVWKYSMFEKPFGDRNYPPLYVSGWQDGCESGALASANHFYRLKYKFRQDWQLLDNRTYISGWENAYDHCRKYVLQHNLRKMKRI